MRLVSFGERGQERAGAVVGERILDIQRASGDLPASVMEILAGDLLGEVRRLVERAGSLSGECFADPAAVRIGAPIPRPSSIVCLGLNYKDHAEEQGWPLPERPLLFSKATTSVTGPYDDVVKWAVTEQADYEVELGVVIGRRAKGVRAAEAYDYVAGYVAFNDVSARDLQFSDKQWFRGKSLDTFAPMGPYLVTKDEIPDPHNLRITMRINGELRQNSNTGNMVFKIPEVIEFITAGITLLPGDIIATGTPAGVGVFMKPPYFLKPGDVMELEVEGVGRQRSRMAAG